jgi:hypothetical protein
MTPELRARTCHGLAVQFARKDPRKYSSSVRAVEKWNELPDEVRAAPSTGTVELLSEI